MGHSTLVLPDIVFSQKYFCCPLSELAKFYHPLFFDLHCWAGNPFSIHISKRKTHSLCKTQSMIYKVWGGLKSEGPGKGADLPIQ